MTICPSHRRIAEYLGGRSYHYSLTLGISAIIGGLIGWHFMPEPRAIDGALVIAGIVDYPAASIQGVYFHNMWTLIHQALALLLAAGVDQAVVANVFNAVLGAVAFSGLALVTLALAENVVLAVTSPLLIVFSNFWLVWSDYPILFFASHSYGQLALSMSVLSVALMGNGRLFSAGVVAGIQPAVHSVLGAWSIAIIVLAAILLPQYVTGPRTRLVKGLLLGAAVSVLSFAWFWYHRTAMPAIVDPAAFRTWMEMWEQHRQLPYRPRTIFFSAMFLACGWMLFDAAKQAGRKRVASMTVLLLMTAVGSQLLYEGAHHFQSRLPDLLVNAMPGRLVNLHFVLAYPVLLALLMLRAATAVTLAATLPIMVLDRKIFHAGYLLHTLLAAAAHRGGGGLVSRLPAFFKRFCDPTPPGNRAVAAMVGIAIVAGSIGLMVMNVTPVARCSNEVLDDCRAPAVFRQLSAIPTNGLVAAPAGLALAMHRHGHKPVLAGASGLDFVAYLPATATQMRDILQDIYGVDYDHPPEDYRGKGYLLPGQGKDYWSTLSVDDWRRLSTGFCIGALVAPDDWNIRLSPILDAEGIRFYVMPWPLPAVCESSRNVEH